jgi:hypothetical protein
VRDCILVWILAAIYLYPCSAGQEQPQDGGKRMEGATVTMRFENGRVTAKFQDQPLRPLAETIEGATGVTIILADGMDTLQVSADLAHAALEDALRNLFSGFDTFFFYGGPQDERVMLRGVWVYPKGSASALKPVRPADCASSGELESMLRQSDPEVRALAWEGLLGRPEKRSLILDALTGARERDAEVRERLLSSALAKGFAIPPEVLMQLARADSSEQIRWVALDALADQPSGRQVAEAAIGDPSESVRMRAREALLEFSRRDNPSVSEPQTQPDAPQP